MLVVCQARLLDTGLVRVGTIFLLLPPSSRGIHGSAGSIFMFARVSSCASVCLRCQRCVTHAPLHRQTPPACSGPARVGRRWQCAAAVKVEDDTEDLDIPHPPEEEILEIDGTASPTPRPRHRFRKWRPSPTAELGVNALGKPAEILILPSRDRKIPVVPTEPDHEPREGLQQSLDSEKEPLSLDQLKENIEHIRTELGQERGQLEPAQWEQLQRTLKDGFRIKHLVRYIESLRPTAPEGVRKLDNSGVRRAGKSLLIKYIAEEIWGYSVPQAGDVQKDQDRTIRIKMKSKNHLELLLRDPRQPFKRVADANNVKLDVFRHGSGVAITGRPIMAAAAQAQLRELIGSIRTSVLELDESLQKWFASMPRESISLILQSLERKYGLLLTELPKKIQMTSFAKSPVAPLIRRELLVACKSDEEAVKFTAWPSTRHTALMPFSTSNTLSFSACTKTWGRLVDHRDEGQVANPNPAGEAERTLYKTLAQLKGEQRARYASISSSISESLGEDGMPWPRKANSPRFEYFARFGQALFDQDLAQSEGAVRRDQITLPLKNPSKLSTSAFVIDIPLLAQFLARRKRWPPMSGTQRPQMDISDSFPLVVRVSLVPTTTEWAAPTLEIFLAGEAIQHGLNQPLRVVRVSAIHDEKLYRLLVPSKPVDITFTRRLREDIFPTKTTATTPGHGKFLKQLRDYLVQGQGQDRPEQQPGLNLPPFVDLKIPDPLFRRADVVETNKAKSVVAKATADQEDKDGTETSPAMAQAEAPPSAIEYMLQSVEVIDTDARATPTKSPFALEHVTYQGGRWGPDRQELRLVQSPIRYAPSAKKIKFHSLFHASMEVVYKLGKVGTVPEAADGDDEPDEEER